MMYKIIEYNLRTSKDTLIVLESTEKLKDAYTFVGDYITKYNAKNVTGAPRNYDGIYIRKGMRGVDYYGLMINNNPTIISIQKM